MSIANLIRRMSEIGATPEMIALAVDELEAVTADLNARRNAARDRKRDQRERERIARESANVTGQVTPCHGQSRGRVSLDKEKAPTPPKEINPIPCVRDARATGWHRLPDDWTPARNLPPQVQAKVDQWPPGALDDEMANFRRWARNAEDKNGKGRKRDWDDAWRNWITRRHDEKYSRQPANSNGLGRSASAAVRAFGDPATWGDEAF